MKSGKRIVLEAAEGITFRVQEGKDEIVIRAIIEHLSSTYSNLYDSPKIPEGYVHVKYSWYEGFVIRNQADGSEFVWIPVGWLDDDATLDGEYFNEKFGRKNWYDSNFSEEGYHEEISQDFIESVKRYGGFYFARYHASKEKGKLVFKKGNMPWVNINYCEAETAAANYAKGSDDVRSCITSGAAFEAVLRWIIKSKAKTYNEVVEDSTYWGNYWNSPNSPHKVMPTGSNEKWSAQNIYDIAGNVDEWTSEQYGSSRRVLRGGDNSCEGNGWPAACLHTHSSNRSYDNTSFRAMLYLK